jgi:hypothetical protein
MRLVALVVSPLLLLSLVSVLVLIYSAVVPPVVVPAVVSLCPTSRSGIHSLSFFVVLFLGIVVVFLFRLVFVLAL